MRKLWHYSLMAVFCGAILTSCNDDDDDSVPDPPMESEEEVITDVKLIFTNTADANDVVEATAEDPDGDGVEELMVLDEIDLAANTTYTLTYEILNALEDPAEDIGDEIAEEDDEHQIFYAFTEDAFTSPSGDGNIDNASDTVNYEDEDSEAQDGSGNPVGLVTTWTTGDGPVSGTFRVRLMHQPDLKDADSDSNTGEDDFDLEFTLNIQ